MSEHQREGIVVTPHCRLTDAQVRLVDGASRELLEDPGLVCYSEEAGAVFKAGGAAVEAAGAHLRVTIPPALVDKALASAPSTVVLGARDPANRLVLDAHEPRVRFVSGAETNVWLETRVRNGKPDYVRRDGCIELLCQAAHLAEHLANLDAFIRCVNIRDPEITRENKDVNKFLASLNNTTKHVQAGLTDLDALDHVLELGRMIAGGEAAFRDNPVLSFITCVIKSPLQVVADTAAKLIRICRARVPVVISSSPMGGTTGPFDEFGMVAQINAEILAGVTLCQMVEPGTPVLYGSVPVRTRLDNLNDMYGAPEFTHYNIDCVQMARFYGLPCYSSAGVGDAARPGIQATAEKMLAHLTVPASGPQYVHYAFGLLERTNVFCPEQAILDDAHIGLVKHALKESTVAADRRADVLATIREVVQTDHKTYMYHLPLPTRDPVYVRYPLEDAAGGAVTAAHRRFREIMEQPRRSLPDAVRTDILAGVPGVLEKSITL
ncbi:MAG: trimethylamine methyltransferase family protein [Kiritimatiellae bacterium]|nr:trimethylamine methyltransferase family protein [Kiritimatiellia bacterium]